VRGSARSVDRHFAVGGKSSKSTLVHVSYPGGLKFVLGPTTRSDRTAQIRFAHSVFNILLYFFRRHSYEGPARHVSFLKCFQNVNSGWARQLQLPAGAAGKAYAPHNQLAFSTQLIEETKWNEVKRLPLLDNRQNRKRRYRRSSRRWTNHSFMNMHGWIDARVAPGSDIRWEHRILSIRYSYPEKGNGTSAIPGLQV
jgi:hypothetical protein